MQADVLAEADLDALIALQRNNHRDVVGRDAARSQGFVTVVHTKETLRAMNALLPSIVCREGDAVVGYALSMAPACRTLLPILAPMFAVLDTLSLGRFYVMGQICVAEEHRGRGVVDLLYREHRARFAVDHDRVVTEIATRNVRSMRAHARVGFRPIHVYRDDVDEWAIVAWDFGA
jgi:ribosomal protein S18 acetylase RimI-like enzyme